MRQAVKRRSLVRKSILKHLPAILPVAAALLAYAAALDNPFVYDDYDTVLANPSLADPMDPRFVLVHSPYRPVVNVSYAIDRLIWGYRPFGFHLTNLLLHAVMVALVYAVIRRVLRDGRPPVASPSRKPVRDPVHWVASFAASVFAVHPLLTEAVGYVSGRSELLCGVFFLSTFLCGRAVLAALPRVAWGGAAGAIAFGVLAFLSKEVAVALPVVLLAYDWIVLPGTRAARLRRLWFFFMPAGAIVAVLGLVRLSALLGRGDNPLSAPHLNLLTQAIVIWRYLALFFVPVGQSIMHGVRYVTSPVDPAGLLAVSGLGLLGWTAFTFRQMMPGVALGFVWFLTALAPSSSVVSLREGMAEHRVYVASVGICLAVASVALAALERRAQRSQIAPTHIAIAAGVLTVLFGLTLARHHVWEHPVRLWSEATVRAAGMWEPHYALGDALREAGQCAPAVPEYEAVIRLRPAHRDAHTNLGICLAQTGRLADAERAFRRALEIDPGFARGLTNLGALAITAGDFEKARQMYLEALQVDGRSVLARMQLARLYEEIFFDHRAAARMCGEARAIQPFTPGVVECVERNERLAAQKDAKR